jgi:hypothetical protein
VRNVGTVSRRQASKHFLVRVRARVRVWIGVRVRIWIRVKLRVRVGVRDEGERVRLLRVLNFEKTIPEVEADVCKPSTPVIQTDRTDRQTGAEDV